MMSPEGVPTGQHPSAPTSELKPYFMPKSRSQTVALLLALFLGVLGADRFYLRSSGMGFLKIFTYGGFGVLWLWDVWKIASGRKMVDGMGIPLRFDLVGKESIVGSSGLGLLIIGFYLLLWVDEDWDGLWRLASFLSMIFGFVLVSAAGSHKMRVNDGTIPKDGIFEAPVMLTLRPELQTELNELYAVLDQNREAAEAELNRLRIELESEKAASSDISSLQSEIEHLTAEVDDAIRQKHNLEDELRAARGDQSISLTDSALAGDVVVGSKIETQIINDNRAIIEAYRQGLRDRT